jgi:hypothetical protein
MRINEPIRNTSLTPADILDLIADGLTYEQIIARHSDLSYKDVFEAADQAANLMRAAGQAAAPPDIQRLIRRGRALRERESTDAQPARKHPKLKEIRRKYPRAFEKWTPEEDMRLIAACKRGESYGDIAPSHGRKASAIRSRLVKLGVLHD